MYVSSTYKYLNTYLLTYLRKKFECTAQFRGKLENIWIIRLRG